MSDGFKLRFRSWLELRQCANMDAVVTLREAERFCADNNENFDDGGKALVEEVFGGEFAQGVEMTGPVFRKQSAEEKSAKAATVRRR